MTAPEIDTGLGDRPSSATRDRQGDGSAGRGQRRWSLVVVALVAALVGGLLAVGGLVAVRDARTADFDARSVRQAERWLMLLSPQLGTRETVDLLERLAATGPLEFVATVDGREVSSRADLSLDVVPQASRELVDDGGSSDPVRIQLDRAYVVVGGQASRSDTAVFFLFDESGLQAGLADLGPGLAAAWAATIVAATASAWLLMRRRVARLAAARDREHRFTADVAHELRTPLGAMVTAASLLEEEEGVTDPDEPATARTRSGNGTRRGEGPHGPTSTSADDATGVLVDGTRRMERLVDHLLELARLDTNGLPAETEHLDLDAVVATILDRRDDPPRVTVGIAPGVVVQADRSSLARIVGNLVDNALEHGEGPVDVAGRRDGAEVVLTVADQGPGIPEQELDALFDRFHTTDEARSSGTGLGLAIAREHAQLLGGTLRAGNREEGGAVFTLRLPAADGPA